MSLYKDLLNKGKEVIDAIELPFKIKKEEKNLEMEILKVEQQIAKDELTVQEEKSRFPINWTKVIDAIDDLNINKRKLQTLLSLEEELFKPKK